MGGSINRLVVRRRTEVERYVLMLLRGGEAEPGVEFADAGQAKARAARRDKRPRPSEAHRQSFAALRETAIACGLSVQPPQSPYLAEDELRLLGWLAQAQRMEGLDAAGPRQPQLLAALTGCAHPIDTLGLRLSPLTLYGGRDSGDSAAGARPGASADRRSDT